MKGTAINVIVENEKSPALIFHVKIENDRDRKLLFTNISSRVMTCSPMRQSINLGRLIPRDTPMYVNSKSSSLFRFYLDINKEKLDYIEDARVDDVWLNIYMSIVFLELEDWRPIGVGWDSFSIVTEGYDCVRIPESDWRKLKEKLSYGKVRIIEISEDVYKLIEEWKEKIKAESLEEAIREAILFALGRKIR